MVVVANVDDSSLTQTGLESGQCRVSLTPPYLGLWLGFGCDGC